MDNDDNVYQGQNLYLVGEEISKVSPVLSPYSLPKFDFDEGHLRFDSLVENEVFLGIPSQEDNQWIEDFSRGSSGIEFSSSATNSCSIPRHNNVWSEATSSESVEMLLKSVGQEEMIPGESTIRESNAGDELPSLTREMDDKIVKVEGFNSESPPGELLGKLSSQNPGAEDAHGKSTSAYGSSGDISEKDSTGLTQENLGIHMKSFDENQREACASVNESLSDKMQEHPFVSVVEVQGAECLSQDVSATGIKDYEIGDHSGQDNVSVVNYKKFSSSSAETRAADLCSPLQVASQVEAMEKCGAEVTATDLVGPSRSPVGNSEVTVEERNEEASSIEPTEGNSSACVAFSKSMEIGLQFESSSMLLEKSSVTNQIGDGNVNMCPVDVGHSDTRVICSEQKSKSDTQISRGKCDLVDKKDDHLGSTGQMVIGSSAIEMEAPVLSEMQSESFELVGRATEHGDDHSLLAKTSTSVEDDCGLTEGRKDGDDAACLHNGDSNAAAHVAPPRQAGSADFYREVLSLKQVDVHECGQSVLVREKAGEAMSSDSGKIGHDSVGSFNDGNGIRSSSLAEVAKENVEAAPGTEIGVSVRIENASNFDVEDTNPLSPDRVKSVSLLNAATAAEVASHNAEQKSNQFEGKRDTHPEAPMDAAKSLLGESRDDPFPQCRDSVAKTVKPDDFTAEKVVLKDVNQSSNAELAETSDAAISVEQVVGDRASSEISDKMELCSVRGDPNAKIGDGAEAVDAQNHEESSGEKNRVAATSEVQGGGFAAEIEKSSSASDGFGGLPQSGMDKQAGVKDGMVENPPLSDSKERIGGKASPNPMSSGLNVVSEEEKSFTFDVSPSAGLPQGGTSKEWQSVPNIQAQKRPKVGDGSASTSGSSQIDPTVMQEISRGSQQTPDKGAPAGGAKGTSERKIRRGSVKSGKENARKGNSMKETVPLKQSERGDRLPVSIGLPGTGQVMQLEMGSVERGGVKPGIVLSVSGSSLPDLNSSAPVSLLFQQPFTDLQQVQLRAQIFVYGSLIQGVAPDEACMVSAFGMSDGGRSFWEPAWRACLERLHGQKTHLSSTETPMQSRSDRANKHGLSQSKVLSTPAGRLISKGTPSPVVNPMMPLSSPLWNISAPSCNALPTSNMVRGAVLDYQALSPLHAYQTSAIRNFDGHTSWSPQAPFPGSWVSSAQSSAVDINARFPAVPITETVKLTSIKESSVPISSGSKIAPPNPISHDPKKVTGSHAQHSADLKSRKRKKTSVSEALGQIAVPVTQTGSVSASVAKSDSLKNVHGAEDLSQGVLVSGNHTELVSASTVGGHFSTSVATTSPSSFVFKSGSDKSLIAVSPVSSIDLPKDGDAVLEKRLLKPEDVAKVEEAKLQAEEASANAAIAVAHCQNVWCQLDKHSTSGMSDVEAKLASAAVAIAASASIAKAAAAAAKIASNVALQAKLMADEALVSNGTQNPTQTELQSVPGFVNNIGNATPASILKVGDENNGSSSIIFAAKEAARRKIEAASAASRHAENLEAIVKAAELAAEAVSQAGKVVTMGDPLSIGKLVEAGQDGYWKGSKLPSGHGAKSNNLTGNKSNINTIEEMADVIVDQSGRPTDKDMHTRNNSISPFPKEISKNMVEDHKKGDEGTSASATHGEKDFRGQKNRRASDLSNMTSVVPDLEIGSRSSAYENLAGTVNDNGIKDGCLVEVFKDNGDFTGAWYSANVLSLKDGKALVSYTDLESDEGSGKLKEWIALEAEGSKPPRIRLAHPMTSITFGGTRKRRRAAVKDYAWSLHDRVDAWIENCWREGVIIEKNKKDETTLSIHFPAQGKTSVVRAWHLRPTLVWKDGEWIEWSNFKLSLQGETPQEKRLKLGSPPVEGKGKAKIPKNIDFAESGKSEESRLLPLSANEKVFNIGCSRNNKPETLRTMRSGLQKEGSKVIFGVPKPGKKRKFMEVSKHYDSDRSIKNNAPNDSEKFAKFLMPHGSGSHGWRNNSKIDPKETQSTEFNKPKGLKSGKPPNLPTKTLPQKDNAGVSSASASKDATLTDNLMKDSTSNDENDSAPRNLIDFVSSNIEAAEEPISLSSQAPTSDAPKQVATVNAKSERLKKGKLAPIGEKSAKVEVKDKPIPEAVEPRRSNRRIQPTSRLLEGLQSSLIISKIPSVSHDKNQRSQNRGASKRE